MSRICEQKIAQGQNLDPACRRQLERGFLWTHTGHPGNYNARHVYIPRPDLGPYHYQLGVKRTGPYLGQLPMNQINRVVSNVSRSINHRKQNPHHRGGNQQAIKFNEEYRNRFLTNNALLATMTKYKWSMKKGGKIPKSGLYKLHKGEVVVPAHRVKTVDKALKKDGKKPLKKVCKDCVMTKKQLKKRKVSKK